jgi:hypothetical protein
MHAKTQWIIAAIAAAAVARLLPHPPNFAPITAMALFGGATLASRRLAFLVPLAAMGLSDLALELTTRLPNLYGGWLRGGRGLHSDWWVVYGTFALIVGIGMLLRKHRSLPALGAATLVSSVLFYLTTNFAAWASGTMVEYPHTAAGLMECYVMGLPFFGQTLLGDAFFVTVLFGGFALAERWHPALRPALAPSELPPDAID